MGFTNTSCDKGALAQLKSDRPTVISIAGNPNVGKSTIFNALTGMNQHTGNWAGKTVGSATGRFKTQKGSYVLVDIPGTYSLTPRSPEEEIARDFIAFGGGKLCVVVCDATCLERNLALVLSITEITENVVVCVNLLDEAKRKGIDIDLDALSQRLGVKAVGTVARDKKSLSVLCDAIDEASANKSTAPCLIQYPKPVEDAIDILANTIAPKLNGKINARWLALKILCEDTEIIRKAGAFANYDIKNDEEIKAAAKKAQRQLQSKNIGKTALEYIVSASPISAAEHICKDVVKKSDKKRNFDRRIDKMLTSKAIGIPTMLLLLLFILWLTISGANYISEILSVGFLYLENGLEWLIAKINMPDFLKSVIIDGAFRVPAIIVSVMLPPMAIFFPLFTILEDIGYLPRVAFNLDKPLSRCNGCGKQALTMCMGLGCNAAGVVGCRIIDSPRERMLAILTNSFMPCNGRLPQHKGKNKKSTLNRLSYLFKVEFTFIIFAISFFTSRFLYGEG